MHCERFVEELGHVWSFHDHMNLLLSQNERSIHFSENEMSIFCLEEKIIRSWTGIYPFLHCNKYWNLVLESCTICTFSGKDLIGWKFSWSHDFIFWTINEGHISWMKMGVHSWFKKYNHMIMGQLPWVMSIFVWVMFTAWVYSNAILYTRLQLCTNDICLSCLHCALYDNLVPSFLIVVSDKVVFIFDILYSQSTFTHSSSIASYLLSSTCSFL